MYVCTKLEIITLFTIDTYVCNRKLKTMMIYLLTELIITHIYCFNCFMHSTIVASSNLSNIASIVMEVHNNPLKFIRDWTHNHEI